MKLFSRFPQKLVTLAATVALMSLTANAETRHNRAVIRTVHGPGAQVSNDKGHNWANAKVGQFLGANSVVKTASDSTVDLFLGDNGPVVRVTPDTSLGIDKLDLENTGIEKVIETQLDLRNGRILGSVKKMAAASKYEVKTPVGVAGIRGTEYDIDSRGRVTIVTGAAVVVYVINGTVLRPANVGAGQTITPPSTAGQEPAIGLSQGNGAPDLTTGVTINPDGTITVTINNGDVYKTTTTGDIVKVGGGPGVEPVGTLAPSPEPIVQADPQHLPGEIENLVSPNQPTTTTTTTTQTGGTSGFGAGVTVAGPPRTGISGGVTQGGTISTGAGSAAARDYTLPRTY